MSVGVPTVAVASPGLSVTPLALTVPVPVFTTWTAKVTCTLEPTAVLTGVAVVGVVKVTARGEGAAVTVRSWVAGVDDSPAASWATTLRVGVPLVT